jgi:phospho-N-acetylmuramoyl-pentapeptide-transferase
MIYITAFLLPLLIIILTGSKFILFIKKLNFGQQIRKYGPEDHLKKSGIPTMGGLLIIGVFIIISIILVPLNLRTISVISAAFLMALTGFLDDFLKIKLKRSLGLTALQKIAMQIAAALIPALIIIFILDTPPVIVPFLGSYQINLFLRFLFIIFVVTGTANAVNLTDGLDGLAAGVTLIVSLAFAVLFYNYGIIDLMLLMLIMAGSCTAFLWFNANPAEIFMGDVGSLGIGGFLAAAAVISGTEIYLLIIGFIYVIETLSVMLQVPYFKLTGGRRIFKMTPIHHHFELKGIAENKIVFRFIIITIIFSLLALTSVLL